MYWKNCGKQISEDAKLCTYCGAKQSVGQEFKDIKPTIFKSNTINCPKCNSKLIPTFNSKGEQSVGICPHCDTNIKNGKCPSCYKPFKNYKDTSCSYCGFSWKAFGTSNQVINTEKYSTPFEPVKTISFSDQNTLKCSNCGSTNISANKKGYSAGKAIAGLVLTGGVGLLGGFFGSGKVKITCLRCGHSWNAGK